MKKITKNVLLAAMLSGSAVFTSQAQVTIFYENFNQSAPFADGSTLGFNNDSFGDTTSESYGQVSNIGYNAGDGAAQLVLNAASGSNGYSGASVVWESSGASLLNGNTSANLSDYTLSFYAKANAGSLALFLQSWSGEYATYQGQMNTYPEPAGYGNDLTLNSGYTYYSLNLGNASIFQSNSGFQPNGGAIQITFQLDGGGATPYTDTLDISDLSLTMVPEPSSLALCALGGLGAFGFIRRRKA
jgi:PEP-CTERM motif